MQQAVTARFATPEDASEFAEWALRNPDIPFGDVAAAATAPTVTLVTEVDGRAELYIPFIFSTERAVLTIGYLGFRPGQELRAKAKALKSMLATTRRLRDFFGCKVRVVTKAEYPMGKWALKNGFIEAADGFYLEN